MLSDNYDTTIDDEPQDINDWQRHKLLSQQMADLLVGAIPKHQEIALRTCAYQVIYRQNNGGWEVASTMTCKDRLCPICAWRRSRKTYGQATEVIRVLDDPKPRNYALLTLTARNVSAPELNDTVTALLQGYKRLLIMPRVKAQVKGYMRSLEITYNRETEQYHPHIHAALVLAPGYYSGGRYIPQAAWTDMWAKAMRLDYTPMVDIRRIGARGDGASMEGGLAEVAKYAVKATDMLSTLGDGALGVALTLRDAMAGRRLLSYGGDWRAARRALNMPDNEEPDDDPEDDANCRTMTYVWRRDGRTDGGYLIV